MSMPQAPAFPSPPELAIVYWPGACLWTGRVPESHRPGLSRSLAGGPCSRVVLPAGCVLVRVHSRSREPGQRAAVAVTVAASWGLISTGEGRARRLGHHIHRPRSRVSAVTSTDLTMT